MHAVPKVQMLNECVKDAVEDITCTFRIMTHDETFTTLTVVISLLFTLIVSDHEAVVYDDEVASTELTLCEEDAQPYCYIPISTKRNLLSAEHHCSNSIQGGYLAAADSDLEQEFLARQAARLQWNELWVSGHLAGRAWHWYSHDKDFAYQGCFIDVPADPNMPTEVMNVTSPESCILTCRAGGYHLAGIQMRGFYGPVMVCHCSASVKFGRHGISYDAQCSGRCPNARPDDGNFLNMYCGGNNRQLIFIVSGERFHSWLPEDQKGKGNCAFIESLPARRWRAADCHDKKAYLCHHVSLSEDRCSGRNRFQWVAGMCIEILHTQKSWYEAVASCATAPDIHLAYIPDGSVVPQLQLRDGVSYWIDLTIQQWKVFDVAPFKYFNWGQDQPTDDPERGCVSLKGPSYDWFNIDCERKLPYFCIRAEEELVDNVDGTKAPRAPTTTTPPGASGLSDVAVLGVGIGAGAAIVMCLLVLAFVCYRYYKKRKKKQAAGATGINMPPEDAVDAKSKGLEKERSLPPLPLEALKPGESSYWDPDSGRIPKPLAQVDSGEYDVIPESGNSGYIVPIRAGSERTYEELHDYLEIISDRDTGVSS